MSHGPLCPTARLWRCAGPGRLGWAWKEAPSSQRRASHIWAQKPGVKPPFPPLSSPITNDDGSRVRRGELPPGPFSLKPSSTGTASSSPSPPGPDSGDNKPAASTSSTNAASTDPTLPAPRRGLSLPSERPGLHFRSYYVGDDSAHADAGAPAARSWQSNPKFFRSVYIANIHRSTTLTELMQAIAAAGPFGMVTSAKLLRRAGSRAGAIVDFARVSGAAALARAAREGDFFVKGVRPFVAVDTTNASGKELRGMSESRVLRVVGMPDVPGFSEEGMRAVLEKDAEVRTLFRQSGRDFWGFDSEPAVESMADDGSGRKIIVWAFFSNKFQTRPFLLALRKHFGPKLHVDFGIDPCGYTAVRDQASAIETQKP
ncbi:unnamed protein product [Discula destructiva]